MVWRMGWWKRQLVADGGGPLKVRAMVGWGGVEEAGAIDCHGLDVACHPRVEVVVSLGGGGGDGVGVGGGMGGIGGGGRLLPLPQCGCGEDGRAGWGMVAASIQVLVELVSRGEAELAVRAPRGRADRELGTAQRRHSGVWCWVGACQRCHRCKLYCKGQGGGRGGRGLRWRGMSGCGRCGRCRPAGRSAERRDDKGAPHERSSAASRTPSRLHCGMR